MAEIIETRRCLLNLTKEADRDEIFALYDSTEVRKYLGGPVDRQSFNTSFDHLLHDKNSSTWTIRLKENSAFVGTISIGLHHDGVDHELSCQLVPEFWGQGLAQEVTTTILGYVAQTIQFPSIIAETQAANVASRKLLEKLDMVLDRALIRFGEEQVIYRKDLR